MDRRTSIAKRAIHLPVADLLRFANPFCFTPDDFNGMAYLQLPDLLSRRRSSADYPAELFVLVVNVCCDDDDDFSWCLHAADSDQVGVKGSRTKVLMRQAPSGKLCAQRFSSLLLVNCLGHH